MAATPRPPRDRTTPKLAQGVRLALNPRRLLETPSHRSTYRESIAQEWSDDAAPRVGTWGTKLGSKRLESGEVLLTHRLDDECAGVALQLRAPPTITDGCEIPTHGSWYSDARSGDEDLSLRDLNGRLTLASTNFEPNAPAPFVLDLTFARSERSQRIEGRY